MSYSISILLADDHALLRETLGIRLRSEKGMIVVGSVSNAAEAVAQVEQHKPDIVLMDVDMPGKSCFDAACEIKVLSPRTRIIFLSAFFHDRYIEDALAAGATGYVTKDESPTILVEAIRLAASNMSYFSPKVQSRIVVTDEGVTLKGEQSSRISLLTKREIETLRYIASGLSRNEIADMMQITLKTLDKHFSRIKTKLQIHERVELARFAIREGLAEL